MRISTNQRKDIHILNYISFNVKWGVQTVQFVAWNHLITFHGWMNLFWRKCTCSPVLPFRCQSVCFHSYHTLTHVPKIKISHGMLWDKFKPQVAQFVNLSSCQVEWFTCIQSCNLWSSYIYFDLLIFSFMIIYEGWSRSSWTVSIKQKVVKITKNAK